jgi:hypothetical protein
MPPPMTVTEMFQNYIHGVFVNTPSYCDAILAAYDQATLQERYGIASGFREHCRVIAEHLQIAKDIPAVRQRAEQEYRVANFDLPGKAQAIIDKCNQFVTQFDNNINSMTQAKWDAFRTVIVDLRALADVTP